MSIDQAARLETSLSPDEVERYYTTLLTGHGWQLGSRTTGEGVSMSRFVPMLDPDTVDTTPRTATLEALLLPGGDVMVTLRVIGPREDWR